MWKRYCLRTCPQPLKFLLSRLPFLNLDFILCLISSTYKNNIKIPPATWRCSTSWAGTPRGRRSSSCWSCRSRSRRRPSCRAWCRSSCTAWGPTTCRRCSPPQTGSGSARSAPTADQSINQSINYQSTINQSINQLINRSVDQSINQLINKSIDQSETRTEASNSFDRWLPCPTVSWDCISPRSSSCSRCSEHILAVKPVNQSINSSTK